MKNNSRLLEILVDTAVEKIAEIHGVSVSQVKAALKGRQEVACREFQRLMREGLKTIYTIKSEVPNEL